MSLKGAHQSASRLLTGAAGLAGVAVITQWSTGLIYFGGDALMALLYLAAWLLAIRIGRSLSAPAVRRSDVWTPLDWFLVATAGAATLSTLLAINQWTGSLALGIWQVDLSPSGRPYGNLAQPNHLSTACFLGLCCASWLHERKRIDRLTYWVLVATLCVGVAMTGSRTGWLQVGLLVTAVAVTSRAIPSARIGPRSAAAVALVFVLFAAAWPPLDELVRGGSGRSFDAMLEGGTRLKHWSAMFKAALDRPLTGYGWQQVSVAQIEHAAENPAVGENIEHSHNLVLDLIVWNGFPVGLALVALLGWWLLRHVGLARKPNHRWAVIALLGLLLHALLEYPLEYAYFLVPAGVLIGTLDRVLEDSGAAPEQADGYWRSGATVLLLAVCAVGYEYARIETAFTTMRLELARVGNPTQLTPLPDVQLLTQLQGLMQLAHSRARPSMSATEIDFMRKTSARYSYPPAMLRYALAAGLNGRGAEATRTLVRLCKIHEPRRCGEAHENWLSAEQTYPVLRGLAPPDWPTP